MGVQLGLWPSPLVKLDRWMGQNAMSCATRMLEGEEVVEHLQKDALSWKVCYTIYIKDANRKKNKKQILSGSIDLWYTSNHLSIAIDCYSELWGTGVTTKYFVQRIFVEYLIVLIQDQVNPRGPCACESGSLGKYNIGPLTGKAWLAVNGPTKSVSWVKPSKIKPLGDPWGSITDTICLY